MKKVRDGIIAKEQDVLYYSHDQSLPWPVNIIKAMLPCLSIISMAAHTALKAGTT